MCAAYRNHQKCIDFILPKPKIENRQQKRQINLILRNRFDLLESQRKSIHAAAFF